MASHQESREATRERLLAAGFEVFTRAGLDAGTVRDIVKQSGLSQGTFYNYFTTKEQVFEKLIESLVIRIRDAVREARARSTSPRAFVADAYRAYLQVLIDHPGSIDLIARNMNGFRQFAYGSNLYQNVVDELVSDLNRGVQAGFFRPMNTQWMATTMIALGVELPFRAATTKPFNPEEVTAFLADLFDTAISNDGARSHDAEISNHEAPVIARKSNGQ